MATKSTQQKTSAKQSTLNKWEDAALRFFESQNQEDVIGQIEMNHVNEVNRDQMSFISASSDDELFNDQIELFRNLRFQPKWHDNNTELRQYNGVTDVQDYYTKHKSVINNLSTMINRHNYNNKNNHNHSNGIQLHPMERFLADIDNEENENKNQHCINSHIMYTEEDENDDDITLPPTASEYGDDDNENNHDDSYKNDNKVQYEITSNLTESAVNQLGLFHDNCLLLGEIWRLRTELKEINNKYECQNEEIKHLKMTSNSLRATNSCNKDNIESLKLQITELQQKNKNECKNNNNINNESITHMTPDITPQLTPKISPKITPIATRNILQSRRSKTVKKIYYTKTNFNTRRSCVAPGHTPTPNRHFTTPKMKTKTTSFVAKSSYPKYIPNYELK